MSSGFGQQDDSSRPALLELINDHHDQHEAAHKRLRETLRDLSDKVDSNFRHWEDQVTIIRANQANLTMQASMPVDAMKLVMSTKAIVSLGLGIALVVGSYWNLSNKLDQQQRDAAASAKMTETQLRALSDAVADARTTAADAKRQYELLRYEFQSLRETVIGKGKTP